MPAAVARRVDYKRRFDVVEFVDDFDNLWWLFDDDDFRLYCSGRFDRRSRRDKIDRCLTNNSFGPIGRQG